MSTTIKSQILNWHGKFLIFLMSAMTIDVLWGVFTRYAIGSQAGWTEELARFLLIWIGVLGAAYASYHRLHLSIDLIADRMSTSANRYRQLLITALIVAFALLVLVIGGSRLIYISYKLGQLSAALRLPMYAVYAVLPISGVLIIYYKLLQLKDTLISS
jgi:TRAP-type C4-dicarboxylate transport system permease small subunit